MHEVTIAYEIIEIVKKIAIKNNANLVKTVNIDVGKLSGVEISSLLFALENMPYDPIFKNTKFNISEKQALGQCSICHYLQVVESIGQYCTKCQGTLIIIDGLSMKVESIEVE